MKNKKQITGPDVGIFLSVIGIIASLLVIIINLSDGDSIAVGIGLVCFSFLSLLTNIRNKKHH